MTPWTQTGADRMLEIFRMCCGSLNTSIQFKSDDVLTTFEANLRIIWGGTVC